METRGTVDMEMTGGLGRHIRGWATRKWLVWSGDPLTSFGDGCDWEERGRSGGHIRQKGLASPRVQWSGDPLTRLSCWRYNWGLGCGGVYD